MGINQSAARLLPIVTVVAGLLAQPARAEQPKSAQAFIDSVGVCTHWSYADTPYGFAYDDVKRMLAASGIKHVRDLLTNRTAELAGLGIRTCVLADADVGSPEQMRDRVKAANAAMPCVDAVEGPNEPDLFWVKFKKSYKGIGYKADDDEQKAASGIVEGVIAYQKDLYAAFKADPATAGITVIGPSLGKTYDPGGGHSNPLADGSLSAAVDWGNFHPYPFGGNPFSDPKPYDTIEKYYWNGNFPSCNLDEFPYAFNVYQPPFGSKPMAATETGYSTDRAGASELAQAKYTPRLFCEYFRKGVMRAYIYELIDEFADPDGGNHEAHFGLLRRDVTPKPAYTALQSLLRLLADPDAPAGFHPRPLAVSYEVTPPSECNRAQYVHHLLLQKSSGEYFILLWHEIADEDTSKTPHRQIAPPDMPTTITFDAPIRRATVYTYDDNWQLQPQVRTFDGGKLDVDATDRMTVIRVAVAGAR